MLFCGDCKNWLCRCDSCFSLVDENGRWYCNQKEAYCSDIDECNEYDYHYEMLDCVLKMAFESSDLKDDFYRRIVLVVLESLGGNRELNINKDGMFEICDFTSRRMKFVVDVYEDWRDLFINFAIPRIKLDYLEQGGSEFIQKYLVDDYDAVCKYLDFDELNKFKKEV